MPIILKKEEDFSKYPNSAEGLPKNYNFEINKTLKTIDRLYKEWNKKKEISKNCTVEKEEIEKNNTDSCKTVDCCKINSDTSVSDKFKITLQFPDGLLAYAPILLNLIHSHFDVDCVILNDVVYGACCVDDELESDLLIHYGHSCLINVCSMSVRVLYIFVDIIIDTEHLKKLIETKIIPNHSNTTPDNNNSDDNVAISVIGTIQFNTAVNKLGRSLMNSLPNNIIVPQEKPLSRGEVLGCTSPILSTPVCVYIGDGRFHLESAMIRNPDVTFYKYCPFTRKLSTEEYDHTKMIQNRKKEISHFWKSKKVGVIVSNLGKQGNTKVYENIVKRIEERNKTVNSTDINNNTTENISYNGIMCYRILIDEINESILDSFSDLDAFVQVGCPRLSIDWGNCYRKPLLSPYELLGEIGEKYEMDYYSGTGEQPWQIYQ